LAQKKDALEKKIAAGNDLHLQLKDAQSLSSDLDYLHSAAAGKSGKNIPFSNYIQSSLLDDVLEAANSRFDKMSKGRFSFRRTDEKGHRKQSAGLEIVIFDQYTATERPAKSLSGGESFMASLSLAMGLSDTVQNHSGGVALDTVFIDEGFGSLDPDTLDSAMMVLGEMIPRGGLVGLISHVSELRERIPARIQVFKGREGSSLKVEA
jgi:exonuclease SbcC